jgi:hypothetical protein
MTESNYALTDWIVKWDTQKIIFNCCAGIVTVPKRFDFKKIMM